MTPRISFRKVRMGSSESASPSSFWDGLRVTLVRCVEGPPLGRQGWFHGVVFTVFHLLEGSVKMRKDGRAGRAGAGEWIACRPGKRFQDFSESARILSIHFLIEAPASAAAWTGEPLVTLTADRELEASARALRATAVLRRTKVRGKISPLSEPATFAESVELQAAATTFLARLLVLLERAGMCYEAPPVRDPRVRDTRQRLALASLRTRFSRAELAARSGLSPAQLDRLWRHELGITPARFWNGRRLETACTLLQGDARTVKEIAHEVGFGHPSQFSSWFARSMGESPSRFRVRHERD